MSQITVMRGSFISFLYSISLSIRSLTFLRLAAKLSIFYSPPFLLHGHSQNRSLEPLQCLFFLQDLHEVRAVSPNSLISPIIKKPLVGLVFLVRGLSLTRTSPSCGTNGEFIIEPKFPEYLSGMLAI